MSASTHTRRPGSILLFVPLVRNRHRPRTTENRIRCASTEPAATKICSRRRQTSRNGFWDCCQRAWRRALRPTSLLRSTCGPSGPSWACSNPRRCCNCNRTPVSGGGSKVSVFPTFCVKQTKNNYENAKK